MTPPDPRSRRHRDALVAEWVRQNGPDFLDQEPTLEALKATTVYQYATVGDALDDLDAAVLESYRQTLEALARTVEALPGRARVWRRSWGRGRR